MRIFVTGTGRCGTSTFYQACCHATNFAAGHESKVGRIGDFSYEDEVIEVSSQLVFFIPTLKQLYSEAKWVHLVRDKNECVKSLATTCTMSMLFFSYRWYQAFDVDPYLVAAAYYDAVTALCAALIPDAFVIRLEAAKTSWKDCWEWMGCQGDFEKSLLTWQRKYNSQQFRGVNKY